MVERKEIARIIDANLNRACEGLRVLEETPRFVNDDGIMAKRIKDFRHDIVATVKEFGFPYIELLDARNSETDVGSEQKGKLEVERSGLKDLIAANFSRVTESLRAIEEYGRLVNPDTADKIKKLRYRAYTLEKQFSIVKKTEKSNDGCACGVITVIVIIVAILYFFFWNPPPAEASTRHDGLTAPRTACGTPHYIQDPEIM